MTGLIELAREAFDRMTNPSYGVGANDDAALRFAELVSPETEQILLQEAASLDDPAALPASTWMWLLEWTAARDVRLSDTLLFQLCEQSESPTFLAAVIAHATDLDTTDGYIKAANADWLTEVVSRATARAPAEQPTDRDDVFPVRWREIQALFFALLVNEDDLSRDAAMTMLVVDRWAGAASLRRVFLLWVADLDESSRAEWIDLARGYDVVPDDDLDR